MASYNSSYGLAGIWLFSLLLSNIAQGSRTLIQNGSVSNKTLVSPANGFDTFLSHIQPDATAGNYIIHYAALIDTDGVFYGAKGTLNVYGLYTAASQATATIIWLANGDNLIGVGWEAAFQRYGDYKTHLVIYWTRDGGKTTGCYNLACEGFQWIKSSKYKPGAEITPVSSYGGDQYEITFKLSKKPDGQEWWLHVGLDSDIAVGFWPNSLFTSLAGTASTLQWGGVVFFRPGEKSPPMGSGHYPEEGERKAAFLKNLRYVNSRGEVDIPTAARAFETKHDCYQISKAGLDFYYFGGPGGCID